jgi:phosphoglucosamine mutase
MRRTGKPLSELKKQIRLFPQVRNDVRVSRKEPLEQHESIQKSIRAAEESLKNKGRVFVRYSGTEPLARVMVEGENLDTITKLSQDIASNIQRILG